ncbi:MAG: hypothetical protein ACI84O_001107 [Myxococcota bacterium]|jgi:hypothetical protein
MRTADFMPDEAFAQHLERRRTPRRVAVLAMFLAMCLAGSFTITAEANEELQIAELAEAPNHGEVLAGQGLKTLYIEMDGYSSRLDSLSDHLRMPTMGPILAELASAVGEYVLIEKIEFTHDLKRQGISKIKSAEAHLDITALVRGDDNLINLPERLREFTEFKYAAIDDDTELIEDMHDTVRTTINLRAELLMPGLNKAKMHTEGN